MPDVIGRSSAKEPRAWVVIPARGGSKGIPCKNLAKIAGRSLIARAIEAGKAAKLVERVMVSTDDSAIAAAAVHAGAEVVERPAEIAGDAANSEAALLHALDTFEQRGDQLPDVLAFVQCTSPFVSAGDIDGTIGNLIAASADTALTAARSYGFLWTKTPAGEVQAINHDKAVRQRRQDRPSQFVEAGSVYAMRVEGFRTARHRFFGKTVIHEVPAARAIEIDDLNELALARAIAPVIDPAIRAASLPSPLSGIVFDFDGVMTDDRLIQDQTGNESVICSRADGLGIELLRRAGIPMIVISRERNPVVEARCRKLALDCQQAVDDKTTAVRAFATRVGGHLDELVYLGNDVNDLESMRIVGLSVAVADAHPRVRQEAGLILTAFGGRGAVRELADIILSRR